MVGGRDYSQLVQSGVSHDNVVRGGHVHDGEFDEEIIRQSGDSQGDYTHVKQFVTIISH